MNQNLRANKKNFRMKGFAQGIALKQRRNTTRKSPIKEIIKHNDILICCTQQVPSTGGGNMFVDSFNVCQKLKESEPHLFQLLATTPIHYYDVGTDVYGEFNMKFSHPMIE